MAADMKKIPLSLPPEIEQEIRSVKKDSFYDRPFSEVYRYIIELGLKAAAEGKGEEE